MKNKPLFLKHYKILFLLSFISIAVVCCKSTRPAAAAKPSLAPVEADVAIAQAHWRQTTLAHLNQGYSIYDDKCTSCHETKRPEDFTVDEWNSILPKMGRKAELDSNQYTLVQRYIFTKRQAILGK